MENKENTQQRPEANVPREESEKADNIGTKSLVFKYTHQYELDPDAITTVDDIKRILIKLNIGFTESGIAGIEDLVKKK